MKYKTHFLVTLTFLFLCTPRAHGAEVSFQVVPNISAQDSATIVEAYLDPEGVSINALEGMVGLLGDGVDHVSSVIIETGSSAFSLWPQHPLYAEDENVIRFTGGAPESITQKEFLFRMRIFSDQPGGITVSWLGGSAYRSDGVGTAEGISSRSLVVSLTESKPNQINASSPDSGPPYFEDVEVARDPDMYDGKYFISFRAGDAVSGVTRYEVIENQELTEVTNGIYVLRDQERNSNIVIIAYDQAGNSTSIKVPARYDWLFNVLIGIVGILVVILLIFRKRIRF